MTGDSRKDDSEERSKGFMTSNPDLTSQNVQSPLISFALITYNQEKYIQEAVEGAFAQTYSPLEIILSDDSSKDGTFQIMEDLVKHYHGPHEVVLNRNETNLGLADHVNKVLQMAKGGIIVLAAGDDISMPERTQMSWDLLKNNPDCTGLSFSTIVFNNHENRIQPHKRQTATFKKYALDELIRNCEFHINGAARSFRKSTFERFGPLKPETPTEDSTILLRCLLTGSVLETNVPQVYYRVHGKNLYASNNKYQIDYQRIHEQYIYDLNTAVKDGLINEAIFNQLEKSLQKRLSRRMTRFKFYRDDNKLFVFLSSILFSKSFLPREKMKYLRQVFVRQNNL